MTFPEWTSRTVTQLLLTAQSAVPQHYGAFFRSALFPLLGRSNAYLMRWSRNKYKRLRGRKKARDQWEAIVKLRPRLAG